jgi:hypothetical protein
MIINCITTNDKEKENKDIGIETSKNQSKMQNSQPCYQEEKFTWAPPGRWSVGCLPKYLFCISKVGLLNTPPPPPVHHPLYSSFKN